MVMEGNSKQEIMGKFEFWSEFFCSEVNCWTFGLQMKYFHKWLK